LQWRHQFGPSASQLAIPGLAVSNPVWQIIWKLKVPNKVKIFIWRALHGIIPLKAILANRHVGTDGGCPICNNAALDMLHMIFKCPMAKDLWESLNLTQVINDAMDDRSGSVVLETLFRQDVVAFQGFNVGLKEVIVVGAWYIWWIRHQLTHNEPVPPLFKCKISILSIAANSAEIFFL
jgi:hypothetical protein